MPRTLSLEECRRHIGARHETEDAALLSLRDQLYLLANVVISAYVGDQVPLKESERLDVEERAAIPQFDANLPPERAEKLALAQRARHRRQ